MLSLLFPHEAERAHVMQTVSQFNQQDTKIFRCGKNHFPEIFSLLMFKGVELDLADFGDPIHQQCNLITKSIPDIIQ